MTSKYHDMYYSCLHAKPQMERSIVFKTYKVIFLTTSGCSWRISLTLVTAAGVCQQTEYMAYKMYAAYRTIQKVHTYVKVLQLTKNY